MGVYRSYLIERGRAETTIDRYDVAAELLNTAFGYRRLLEVTTHVPGCVGSAKLDTATRHASGRLR